MEYRIEGVLAQMAHLEFAQGETCWAHTGSILVMDPDLEWNIKVPGDAGAIGKRILSGLSMIHFEAKRNGQKATLSTHHPGKIITWDLAQQGPVVATRGSFVAAWGGDVHIDVMTPARARAAFFGGAGLFLQRVSGQGTALLHGAGDFIDLTLGQGEQILASTGNISAFAQSVDYDVQGVGGFKKAVMGGEGGFMAKLTGPGRVLLQSMRHEIADETSSR